LVAVLLAASFLALRRERSASASGITIGVVLPLTGPAATYGNNALRGLQLALKQRPELTDGKKVTLSTQDSKSDTAQAVSALQAILATQPVNVVIGDTSSSSVLAMAPVAQAAKIVLISPCASNAEISKAGSFIFRTWQSDADEGKVGAKYARDQLKWKTVVSLYIDNAYGQGMLKVFRENFVDDGHSVVGIPYPEGASDLRSQITQLKGGRYDGIYLLGFPNELVLALRQLRDQQVSLSILATQAIDDPAIYTRAKDAADGVLFTTTVPPDANAPAVKSFTEAYKGQFHLDPGLCSDSAFDAANLVLNAFNDGQTAADLLRQFLHNVRNYAGASGPITFNASGDVEKPIQVKRIAGGQANLIWKQD
jgi:branched-chain amino acid transport system substrate-binding protein